MNNLNWKLIIVALLLFSSAVTAYYSWDVLKFGIAILLKSPILTLAIWASISIIAIMHYFNNHTEEPNSINDKEGLEKPMNYFQFIGTYATILTSAQTFSKEFFLQWNFPNETNCKNFTEFDRICIVSCIFVLMYYSFVKIRPVFEEAFKKKAKVRMNEPQEKSNI